MGEGQQIFTMITCSYRSHSKPLPTSDQHNIHCHCLPILWLSCETQMHVLCAQDVYLMIAGSFGVSTGLEQTGAAAAIANMIVSIGRSAGGQAFTIAAIYVATVALSQVSLPLL